MASENAENVISVVDFINSFNKPENQKDDYGLAYLDYQGMLRNLLGNEPYPKIEPSMNDIGKTTRFNYLKQNTAPSSAHAIDALAESGFEFPITYGSKEAEKLFILYAMNLAGGNIGKDLTPGFHIIPEHLESIQERTGLEFNKTLKDYYKINESGSAFGRVLYLMGLSNSKKDPTSKPDLYQIDYCIEHIDDLPELSKIIINEMIYNKRLIDHGKNPYRRLGLKGHHVKKSAKEFADKISKLMEAAFSGMKFEFKTFSKITQTKGKPSTLWVSYTALGDKKVRRMQDFNVLSKETVDKLFE